MHITDIENCLNVSKLIKNAKIILVITIKHAKTILNVKMILDRTIKHLLF